MTDCKRWKIEDRGITEEEAFRLVERYSIIEKTYCPEQPTHNTDISEDRANTLACVYHYEKSLPYEGWITLERSGIYYRW